MTLTGCLTAPAELKGETEDSILAAMESFAADDMPEFRDS